MQQTIDGTVFFWCAFKKKRIKIGECKIMCGECIEKRSYQD